MTELGRLASVVSKEPDSPPGGLLPSAVLVGLLDGGVGGPKVVLTERAGHLRHHAGQISFPGGRIEPGETQVEAALREAEEEVGLSGGDIEILGHLPGVTTTAGFHIAPVLGAIRGRPELRPDPGEVERILVEPVGPLLEPANHEPVMREHKGRTYRSWTIRHDREHIWGATARLIVRWSRLLYPPDPEETET